MLVNFRVPEEVFRPMFRVSYVKTPETLLRFMPALFFTLLWLHHGYDPRFPRRCPISGQSDSLSVLLSLSSEFNCKITNNSCIWKLSFLNLRAMLQKHIFCRIRYAIVCKYLIRVQDYAPTYLRAPEVFKQVQTKQLKNFQNPTFFINFAVC